MVENGACNDIAPGQGVAWFDKNYTKEERLLSDLAGPVTIQNVKKY